MRASHVIAPLYEMEHFETNQRDSENRFKLYGQLQHEDISDCQVAEVCSSLAFYQRFDVLGAYLRDLGTQRIQQMRKHDIFLRALIAFKIHKRHFKDVYKLLEESHFASTDGLLEIWDDAHYREKRIQLGRELTPLIKYRVRQKFPPPLSIAPDGKRPSAKLPPEAVCLLKSWLTEHCQSPYPTQAEKEELAKVGGLTVFQVKTWFANARRRLKSKKITMFNLSTDNSKGKCESLECNPEITANEDSEIPKDQGNHVKTRDPEAFEDAKTATRQQVSSVDGYYFHHETPYMNAPSSPGELNASKSLQAMAGMCENIQPHTVYHQTSFNQKYQLCNENVYGNGINNTPYHTANVFRSFCANQNPEEVHSPKESSLWQPFKSLENLASVEQNYQQQNKHTQTRTFSDGIVSAANKTNGENYREGNFGFTRRNSMDGQGAPSFMPYMYTHILPYQGIPSTTGRIPFPSAPPNLFTSYRQQNNCHQVSPEACRFNTRFGQFPWNGQMLMASQRQTAMEYAQAPVNPRMNNPIFPSRQQYCETPIEVAHVLLDLSKERPNLPDNDLSQ